MLRIQGLSKTYPNGVQALRGIDLEIPTGMFGLLGPNGAGKSTLMRTIATLQGADCGLIHLGDCDVLREPEQIRRVLGYLPQEFGLYANITAEAMLDHLAVLKGLRDRRERKTAITDLMQLTDLWDVRRQRLGTFSGGMRQRFGIAQALLGDPKLIIVDEPTAGLDPEGRQRFLNLLGRVGRDIVVLLSTHIVADVGELCTNMAIINEGRVLVAGDPRDLVKRCAGRIWQRTVSDEDVDAYRTTQEVLSTRLFAGRTIVRIYSGTTPGEGFAPVEPDLEDVYFLTLRAGDLN
ncbi:ABC transporter ATP-binding protein [Candidatus Eisenbacteria bacterium]|uniref:ABC transporter ATP-binding protein n=1 Tax=Eiseniibacteriota bacterium TaxID=2212470 RepID=A0ABV6YL92_UNCEI